MSDNKIIMSSQEPVEEAVEFTAHDFYDRQRRAVGARCMEMLAKAKVLICGLGGLGTEIAKNVILTGPNTVYLYDSQAVTSFDLSTNFYGTAADVAASTNRVDAVMTELKELNPYVTVERLVDHPTIEWMQENEVTVFVCCNMPLTEHVVAVNQQCREAGIKFVAASIRGLCGQLFVDAGIEFSIYDHNGVAPAENNVIDISPVLETETETETEGEEEEPSGEGEEEEEKDTRLKLLVSVMEEEGVFNHGMGNGDKVVFASVPGMDPLVKLGELDIVEDGRHSFFICLPEGTTFEDVGVYEQGKMGYCTQVKGEVIVNHSSLTEQIQNPSCLVYDFAKIGYSEQRLHPLFRALGDFMDAHEGDLPRSYNAQDADEMFELAKVYNPDLDEEFAKKFAFTAKGDINPIAAFFGGFAAQQVQILATGKYTPLNQFFYFDAFECLPQTLPTEEDATPEEGSRYAGQIAVFGKVFQQRLHSLKLFMVGAGALGCEYLKNFALMGLGTDVENGGVVKLTDMDVVEPSNLNRQFLFRQRHIRKLKSTSAAETVAVMNPELNVEAYELRVGKSTENFFNQKFWDELDFVVNALDNVSARLYVDGKIVDAKKPLVEAGTTGPQANLQIIVPNLTESYGDQRDPDEKVTPACTLKNFPYQISHCITWARDAFQKYFHNRARDVNAYVDNPNYLEELTGNAATKLEVLNPLFENITNRPSDFSECVGWSRLLFADFFQNNIIQLLHSFPPDAVDKKTSLPFWSGSKRCPTPLEFDFENELHRAFILSCSHIAAEMFAVEVQEEFDFGAFFESFEVPVFVPSSAVKIQTGEDTEEEGEEARMDTGEAEVRELEELLTKLPPPVEEMKLKPIGFEKDDDSNGHIDFVTAVSNCRGSNYEIPAADRDKTKGIAGRIIPAMVTTTAMITGVGCLEIYKLVRRLDEDAPPVESYKNTFLTLALPAFYQSEPGAPKKLDDDGECSKWDALGLSLGRDITIQEFIDYFKEEHNVVVSSIAYMHFMYCTWMPGFAGEERLNMKVSEAAFHYCPATDKPSDEAIEAMTKLYLTVLFDDDALDVPMVSYQFKGF